MDGPEVHAPHKAHTGHRWLDITLGVSALMVSAISLYVAVHHGETMEKLVEANSFPNAELNWSIAEAQDPKRFLIKIDVENNGVGPARIETVEFWDGQKPLPGAADVVTAVKAHGDGRRLDGRLGGGTVLGSLLGAGKSKTLMSLEMDRAVWFAPALRFSTAFQARVCYCSVFDECFVTDSRVESGRAKHATTCPAPAHPYQDDIGALMASKAVGETPGAMSNSRLSRAPISR